MPTDTTRAWSQRDMIEASRWKKWRSPTPSMIAGQERSIECDLQLDVFAAPHNRHLDGRAGLLFGHDGHVLAEAPDRGPGDGDDAVAGPDAGPVGGPAEGDAVDLDADDLGIVGGAD